ncbi:MAG: DUF6599 family protein [Syntrophales bacterium]
MKLWACLLGIIGICSGCPVVWGQEKDVMKAAVVLPAEAGGWQWDRRLEQHDSRTLYRYMDGAAELYLAYGFRGLTVRRFQKPGAPSITVELYALASPADAYGVFTFERQDQPAGIGQGSEFGGGMLRFWKGVYLASIYADGEGGEVESALIALGKAVAAAIPETGPEPELIGSLPGRESGLREGSVRFLRSHVLLNQRFFIAHQNVLNLDKTGETVLAQYLRGGEKPHLLVVRYPDPRAAAAAYGSFLTAYLPDSTGKGRVRTDEGRWTIAERQGRCVLVVFGAATESDADALLNEAKGKLPRRR